MVIPVGETNDRQCDSSFAQKSPYSRAFSSLLTVTKRTHTSRSQPCCKLTAVPDCSLRNPTLGTNGDTSRRNERQAVRFKLCAEIPVFPRFFIPANSHEADAHISITTLL